VFLLKIILFSLRDVSPVIEQRSSRKNSFSKADYADEHGHIDKQKLLEIATRNATRLAMVVFSTL
jgi:hypothetical protein